MVTQLQIDEKLLQEALKLGEHQNKKSLIEEALTEYIQNRKQIQILDFLVQLNIKKTMITNNNVKLHESHCRYICMVFSIETE